MVVTRVGGGEGGNAELWGGYFMEYQICRRKKCPRSREYP